MAHLFHRCPPKGVRGGLRRPEGVGEEIRTFPDFFPTRGGHGVDGVRGGRYINQGAQSLMPKGGSDCVNGSRILS